MNYEIIQSLQKRGFKLLPLKPFSKHPMTKHGYKDASNCPHQIESWFKDKDVNVGIATGPDSGIFVIDIDIKNGKDGLKSLMKRFGDDFFIPKDVLLFQTASGGYHIPVKWDDRFPVRNQVNARKIKGIDIRGIGGYAVTAPSKIRKKGSLNTYKVANLEGPLAVVEGWIKELIAPTKREVANQRRKKKTFNPKTAMKGIGEGQRNDQLFRYACHLSAMGLDQSLVIGFVKEAAARCRPPLDVNETEKIISNAFSYRSKNAQSLATKPSSLEEIL